MLDADTKARIDSARDILVGKVLDPACGTAGFLISAYKHILKVNQPQDAQNSQKDYVPSVPFRGQSLTPDERVSPKFLYHCLSFAQIPNLGYSRHFRELVRVNIPLPPLEEQERMVAELEGYRKIIEGARQVIANYKPTIRIDPEWPWVRIGDLCSRIQYGISTPLNTNGAGYKTFRMNEIADGLLVDNGAMKCAAISANEFSKYRLDKSDVFFNRTNSYEHVGRTGIFILDGEYTFASYLVRLAIDCSKTSPEFLNR